MSNGYLVAAGADVAAAREISDGFGLDVIDAASIGDPNSAASGLAAAANVGVLVSSATASDAHYVAVLLVLAQGLERAQLILVDGDARAALPFLPASWPAMSLADARTRSAELVRRRDGSATTEQPHAAPVPTPPAEPPPEPTPAPQPVPEPAPQPESPPVIDEPQPDADAAPIHAEQTETGVEAEPSAEPEHNAAEPDADAYAPVEDQTPPAPPLNTPWAEPVPERQEQAAAASETAPPWLHDDAVRNEDGSLSLPGVGGAATDEAPAAAEPSPPPEPAPAPMPSAPPQIQAPAAGAPPEEAAPAPQASETSPPPKTRNRAGASAAAPSAPADATAFAPKKLRRGEAELVQVTIHQPQDLKAVIKAAKKANPSAEPAPQGVHIGDLALGASIGVSLEVRGAACDGALQRRPWRGEPIDFSFSVEADGDAKKAVIIARVFIDDAQIGVIGFTRPISGPAKKAASTGDAGRLKRHKRVFLSYSSHDRETVSAIATAYEAAGVPHFWDRASLKSGEEWSPRLRKEIDRADLFHLCWSKSASSSEWVEKETEHALTRRKRSNGKNPDITVQMLDGPPWAPHPAQLDAINFDDFVRAAIVGYARGDGST